jgi:TonB family protein
MFSLLPEPKSRWKEFVFGYGSQGAAIAIVLSIGILRPQILSRTVRDYRLVALVRTPAPINRQPAPVRVIQATPVIARLHAPIPDNLRLVAPRPQPTRAEAEPPRIQISQPEPAPVIETKPVIPRQLVRTNVFSTGSSAPPTIAAAPRTVQTGGFGDPNGVPGSDNHGKPVTIAQVGSFDLPSGAGQGNGAGGARGKKGVVASAGFGSGIATGDGSASISTSRGTVREGGFGDADVSVARPSKIPRPDREPASKTPVEIISKPTPVYTEEARKLRIEGEVLLEVVFEASGRLHVIRILQGLGHGLDENAQHAAEQIRFKPALKEGKPADSTATVHIVFQLA